MNNIAAKETNPYMDFVNSQRKINRPPPVRKLD